MPKSPNDAQKQKPKHRGFASMSPEKQREIASMGGKAAHAQGRAHEFSYEEARWAGRMGGEAVSQNRLYMAQIGRAGGIARGRRARERLLSRESSPASCTVLAAPRNDEAKTG